MKHYKSLFSVRIKELRLDKKLTQKQLAEMFGLTEAGVRFWENRDSRPSYEILMQLASYFDVSIDYLVGYKDY